jgi:hypothetical protein
VLFSVLRHGHLLFLTIFDSGSIFLFTGSLLTKLYTYSRTYWATSSFGTYKLLSDDSKTKISELLVTSNNVVRDFLEHHVSWLLCPVLAGLGMTLLTWYVIYTDSCIPGVKPPTPFSPSKNRYVYLRGEFLFSVTFEVREAVHL